MLSLTRSTDYALVAISHLARHAPDSGQAVSARCIAEKHDLPASLLMNLLKQLHKAGILGSTRGACGGYHLARPAEQITLDSIVTAIEGPVQLALCCDDEKTEDQLCEACQVLETCPVKTGISQLSAAIAAMLGSVTVADLIHGRVADAIQENTARWARQARAETTSQSHGHPAHDTVPVSIQARGTT